MGPLGGFVVVSMQEDHFGYGAEALVIQGRPPAHGAGQVFDVAGGSGETARAIARRNQAHGLASRLGAEIEGHQEELAGDAFQAFQRSRSLHAWMLGWRAMTIVCLPWHQRRCLLPYSRMVHLGARLVSTLNFHECADRIYDPAGNCLKNPYFAARYRPMSTKAGPTIGVDTALRGRTRSCHEAIGLAPAPAGNPADGTLGSCRFGSPLTSCSWHWRLWATRPNSRKIGVFPRQLRPVTVKWHLRQVSCPAEPSSLRGSSETAASIDP